MLIKLFLKQYPDKSIIESLLKTRDSLGDKAFLTTKLRKRGSINNISFNCIIKYNYGYNIIQSPL